MNARSELLLGLRHGMPIDEYHSVQALGSSGLKNLARSPRHFHAMALDSQRPPQETTPSMVAGTLAHCAVLEPDEMQKRYVIRPPGTDLRAKIGKEWAASVPNGVTILTEAQHSTAWRQARAIRALPEIEALLNNGQAEVSAFWLDDETGAHCKCRPDFVSPAGDGVILTDVKTCQDASPAGFVKTVVNFNYAAQAAWYSDGYAIASGKPVLGFVFAAVEADYPHAAAAYMLPEEWLGKARVRNAELLRLYVDCIANNYWPAYAQDIQQLEAPKWI